LWERSNRKKSADELSILHLVSSDTTGHIIVWDVAAGNPRAVLQEGSKPVLGKENVADAILMRLHWVHGYPRYLLVLLSLCSAAEM
jgi:hypothetical protein